MAGLNAVGMSGLPVRGGAGIKPALVQQGEAFFLPDDRSRRLDANELRELVERGLVAIFSTPQPYSAGDVVLYAHEAFSTPGRPAHAIPFLLKGSLEPRLSSIVAVLPRDRALDGMRDWAIGLIEWGVGRLLNAGNGAAEAALNAATRARFAAPADVFPAERRRALALQRAALVALQRSVEELDRDARLDFPGPEVSGIAADSKQLLARQRAYLSGRTTDRELRDAGTAPPRELRP